MSGTVARNPMREIKKGAEHARLWLGIGVFGWLWCMLIMHLSLEWNGNPQYAYGWAVPFLAAYLFARRWGSRPPVRRGPGGLLWLALFLSLSLLPVRLIEEANPDWHLVSWILAIQVTGLTLCAIAFCGGSGWLRHFAFPVLFILAAVPWPDAAALSLTQNLMRIVALLTTEMLNLCGIPAIQQGNVIEIGSGFVGVDEACSGVRSMQGMLMVSLFFGELYGFRWMQRLLLIAAGSALAFVCNLLRAGVLAWLTARHGTMSLDRWHDPAGLAILVVSFLGLLAAIRLFFPRPTERPAADPGHGRLLPVPVMAVLALWFTTVEAATEGWYRWHERRAPPSLEWSVELPRNNSRFQPAELPELTIETLGCDEWQGASWRDEDRGEWLVYYLRWLPDISGARLETRVHNPGICLPARGFEVEEDLGVELMEVSGVLLPVHSYIFSNEGRPLHVFFAVCQDNARSAAEAMKGELWGRSRRLDVVARGERRIGYRVIEAVLKGTDDAGEARDKMRVMLTEIVRTGTSATPVSKEIANHD